MKTTELLEQFKSRDGQTQRLALLQLAQLGAVSLDNELATADDGVWRAIYCLAGRLESQPLDVALALTQVARALLDSPRHGESHLFHETMRLFALLTQGATPDSGRDDDSWREFVRRQVALPQIARPEIEVLAPPPSETAAASGTPAEDAKPPVPPVAEEKAARSEPIYDTLSSADGPSGGLLAEIPPATGESVVVDSHTVRPTEVVIDYSLEPEPQAPAADGKKGGGTKRGRKEEPTKAEEQKRERELPDGKGKELPKLVSAQEQAITGRLRQSQREPTEPLSGRAKRQSTIADKTAAELSRVGGLKPPPAGPEGEKMPTTPVAARPALQDLAKEDKLENIQSPPVTKLLNLIFQQATRDKASRLSFEFTRDGVTVFLHTERGLVELVSPPARVAVHLIDRLKMLCGADIMQDRLSQEGSMTLQVGGQMISCRVTTQPTPVGENCQVRMLSLPPARKPTKHERPYFEKLLADDAGAPGPLERLAAQSVWLLKTLQATIGLRFILLANACDIVLDTVAGYVRSLFEACKTGSSIQRRLARRRPQDQIIGLAEDITRGRIGLSRLFSFAGFSLVQVYARRPVSPAHAAHFAPTFALRLALDVRSHLDDMKRDLSLLTARQVRALVSKSLLGFVTGLVPNPTQLFAPWKDWFVMALCMRYTRPQIEAMYVDLAHSYNKLIFTLWQQHRDELGGDFLQRLPAWQLVLANYEKDMAERYDNSDLDAISELEKLIDHSRRALQRLVRMLTNTRRYLDPRLWSKQELVDEVRNMHIHDAMSPLHALELEYWLSHQIALALVRQGMRLTVQERQARLAEAGDRRRRYRLARRLWAQFVS